MSLLQFPGQDGFERGRLGERGGPCTHAMKQLLRRTWNATSVVSDPSTEPLAVTESCRSTTAGVRT